MRIHIPRCTLISCCWPWRSRRPFSPARPTGRQTGPIRRDAAQIAELKRAGFPLVDFHVHLKGGLTIDEAVALSRRNGIKYGLPPTAD